MANISLNLINHSRDNNIRKIVVFSKNFAPDSDDRFVVWIIIEDLEQGDYHMFDYPSLSTASATDSLGNTALPLLAETGQRFSVSRNASGNLVIQKDGASDSPDAIEIVNILPAESITANVFKDGKLFANQTNVQSGEKALFEFKPVIWIGVVTQIMEGQTMDGAIAASCTEFNLEGMTSASIVITGGGTGPNAGPFTLTLESTT